MKSIFIAICILSATTAVALPGKNFGHMVIIGDSITQASGNNYTTSVYPQNQCRSYRWELFKSLVDAGATFDFNGSIANNYQLDSAYPTWRGIPFYRANEGHFGWRAREILNGPDSARRGGNRGVGAIAQWLDTSQGGYTPDTAIIMIGINDLSDYVNAGTTDTASAVVSNYVADIVGVLQTNNPKIRIYLCDLLQVGSGHSQYVPLNRLVDDYNHNKLPGIAVAATTANSKVTVIDMLGPTNNGANVWTARPNGWDPNTGQMTGSDRVHPNSRGERYIASRIASALGLIPEWTAVPIVNGNFEEGFINSVKSNCAPIGWTLYGAPNATAVPKQVTDYQVVADSTVDLTASGTNVSAGSSYIIAGNADTGIKQTLTDTLTAGRHYMLQGSLFSGSAALTSEDWGVEIWAVGIKLAQADNQILLKTYSAGTASQIGSHLTEITVEFEAADFPSLIGQPLELRLISRNSARYIGFEDVRLSWKPSTSSAPKHYKIYVLSGQSNSLGTDSGTEINKLPGCDPADAQIPFWWHNISGDIFNVPTASKGYSIGSSGGFWKTLQAQFAFNEYSNITNAFGPEINFGRTMFYAGQTNLAIIKASRGGGGNSFWCKTNADDHMYVLLTNTVITACQRMTANGNTFEVAGLLYLQGESDSAYEASVAGERFKMLMDNLTNDLPNATNMKGYMIGNLTTAVARRAQEVVAAQYPSYLFYCDSQALTNEWVSDNLHQNKKAKLVNGARFAQLVLGQAAHYDASKSCGGIFGQQYGNAAAGVAPFSGLTSVTTGRSPIFQGWAESPSSAATAAAINAATNQSSASIMDSGIPAWNITDGDTVGEGYYYSREFTGTQTTNFANSGWVYSLNARFPTGYTAAPSFFFQYGDASIRWLAYVKLDSSGSLSLVFTNGGDAKIATAQSNYDNAYHNFTLRKTGAGTDAELVFDGVTLATISPVTADARLAPGAHFGTCETAGKGAVNIRTVDFSAPTVTLKNILSYIPGANGTIGGAATQTVNHVGSGSPVLAVANPNYMFIGWSDGRLDNPRTDTNVIFDVSVTANFAPGNAPFILTAAADDGTIEFSWPSAGWTLEYNTNLLSAGWQPWPDSATTNSILLSNHATAFFRLRFP